MMGHKMCTVHKVAWWLLFVGGVNWGLIGALNLNLVNRLLGAWPAVERIVYVLVGASAVMMCLVGRCKACMSSGETKRM